jgi:hypothetical protein
MATSSCIRSLALATLRPSFGWLGDDDDDVVVVVVDTLRGDGDSRGGLEITMVGEFLVISLLRVEVSRVRSRGCFNEPLDVIRGEII